MNRYLKNFIQQHFIKNRISSIIIILSLVIAYTSCLLIYTYTLNETRYDKNFPNHEQLFRVASKVQMGGIDFSSAMAAPPLAKTLVREIPEVQMATRLWEWDILAVKKENADGTAICYNEKLVMEADSNFFNVFKYELISGNSETCLINPNSIVVTEATAIKYFGNKAYSCGEVMGQNLYLKIFGKYRPYQIMGICKNPPQQMHFGFNIIFSSNCDPDSHTNHWLNNTYYTYIRLAPSSDIPGVEEKLKTIVDKYINQGYDKNFALNEKTGSDYWAYVLQPVSSIHLNSDYERELKNNSSVGVIRTSIGIALMILVIALLNYMNLFTISNLNRSKEIAVKKISGMKTSAVFFGFIAESIVFVLIAISISLSITLLTYKLLAPISPGISDIFLLSEPYTYLLIFFIITISGLAGGLYPAIRMTNEKNIQLLKSVFEKRKSGNQFRQLLVVTQFIIAMVLIISSIVISQQLNFLLNKNPGFNYEQVLVFDAPVFALRQNFENFKTKLLDNSKIIAVSTANTVPGDGDFNFPLYLKKEGESAHQVLIPYEGNFDFISTLGLDLIAGRDFEKNFDNTNKIILNEKAVQALGINEPVGKYVFESEVRANNEQLTRMEIIGVVKNIHFESFRKEIRPFAIRLSQFHNYMIVRTAPEEITQTIAFIEKNWDEFYPDSPFSFTFLNKKFEALYSREAGLKLFFLIFTGLAIFIAIIGLFALSMFIANQRTKEIGIRKVNGAKVSEVLTLLNNDFVLWVTIAFIISCPLAYFTLNKWLQSFAYKITLSWWIFALAGITALSVALLTVSWQSWKAATKNPVDALRCE